MNAQWQARFAEKMRGEGLPEIAIDAFVRSLGFLGDTRETLIAEADLSPVEDVPTAQHLERFEARGRQAVSQAAVIKLNGGLGTSMGLSRAKSLLPVRPGSSFLDLIVRQVLWQRAAWDTELPLVLMNSDRTRRDSLEVLSGYPELDQTLPVDFLQHRVPRVDAESLARRLE